MNKHDERKARAAAEAQFRPAPPTDAERAQIESDENSKARDAKTARLKAERLAKEAPERGGSENCS
jgi:hypothetical protein